MPPSKSERKSFISFVLNTVSFPVKIANTEITLLKLGTILSEQYGLQKYMEWNKNILIAC